VVIRPGREQAHSYRAVLALHYRVVLALQCRVVLAGVHPPVSAVGNRRLLVVVVVVVVVVAVAVGHRL